MKLTLWEAVCHKGEGFGGDFDPSSLFGGQGGGGFGQIPNVQSLFPGVPVPRNGVADQRMAGGNPGIYASMGTPAPDGGPPSGAYASTGTPAPGGWGGQGLQPWKYEVPNPQAPKPPRQHADFEGFPGGRGGGGGRRRGRRRQRRNRYFDQLGGGGRPDEFWDGGR